MQDEKKTPQHIAIIMDGNGRWAKEKGLPRVMGHKAGVEVVENILEAALENNIKYLTLYTFSYENWKRPQSEVSALMNYLKTYLNKADKEFNQKGIRLLAIGELGMLHEDVRQRLYEVIDSTRNNSKMNLILALSYGSRQEITKAVKNVANDVKNKKISLDEINENLFNKYLYTAEIPDPDILIRTSYELRLSNFLLWQLSYTELYFSRKFWPDFTKEDFKGIIADFMNRERRYGNI
jgi:undecaprenyl diphosphate synthase